METSRFRVFMLLNNMKAYVSTYFLLTFSPKNDVMVNGPLHVCGGRSELYRVHSLPEKAWWQFHLVKCGEGRIALCIHRLDTDTAQGVHPGSQKVNRKGHGVSHCYAMKLQMNRKVTVLVTVSSYVCLVDVFPCPVDHGTSLLHISVPVV